MQSRVFHHPRGFALGFNTERVCLSLSHQSDHVTTFSMSAAEARAMAVALEAAATYAENVIADTGLGESAAVAS